VGAHLSDKEAHYGCLAICQLSSAASAPTSFAAPQRENSQSAAMATALLLGLIARDDVGMSADMIRTDALSAAGLIFVAVATGSLLRRKK
jgi:hypothetical protein